MNMTVFHWLLLAFTPLYVFLKGPVKYYDLLIILITAVPVHWYYFKGECIISYLHKKYKDCSYRLGERPEADDILVMKSRIPLEIVGMITLFCGYLITKQLGYNIPMYFIIQIIPRVAYNIVKNESFTQVTKVFISLLSLLFLKDNKYLLASIGLTLGSSCIIRKIDEDSCVVK